MIIINIKLILLSNKKILAFCKNEKGKETSINKILYTTLNDDYTIKFQRLINDFFNYSSYFENEKEKLLFYWGKKGESHILNINTFEISKFNSNYNYFFNYIN